MGELVKRRILADRAGSLVMSFAISPILGSSRWHRSRIWIATAGMLGRSAHFASFSLTAMLISYLDLRQGDQTSVGR
jgi:hypothetical protein